MSGESQPVFKFYQFVHCKFGTLCSHSHNEDISSKHYCSQKLCTATLLRPCVFFRRNKFFSDYSYLHKIVIGIHLLYALNELSEPSIFLWCCYDKVFQDIDMFMHHLREEHGCRDTCGILYQCVNCALIWSLT